MSAACLTRTRISSHAATTHSQHDSCETRALWPSPVSLLGYDKQITSTTTPLSWLSSTALSAVYCKNDDGGDNGYDAQYPRWQRKMISLWTDSPFPNPQSEHGTMGYKSLELGTRLY